MTEIMTPIMHAVTSKKASHPYERIYDSKSSLIEQYCSPLACFDLGLVRHSTYQLVRDELAAEQQDHERTRTMLRELTIQFQGAKNVHDKISTELREENYKYQSEVEAQKQTRLELNSKLDTLVREAADAKEAIAKATKATEDAEAALLRERAASEHSRRRYDQLVAESEKVSEGLEADLAKQTRSTVEKYETISELELENFKLQMELTQSGKQYRQKLTQMRRESRKAEQDYDSLDQKYERLRKQSPRTRLDDIDFSTFQGVLEGIGLMERTASDIREHWPYRDWPWGTKGTTKSKLIALRASLKMYP